MHLQLHKQGVWGQDSALALEGKQHMRLWVTCLGHPGCFSYSCVLISFHQKSELDEWAKAMNAEFEAAEQFDLLIE